MPRSKRVTDLTQGVIWKNLIKFAIPLLLSSLVQQLYNTVDLIFAGNVVGSTASAAIGVSSLLITCLVGFFGGMSVGSGVVISQYFGKQDHEGLRKSVHSAIGLALTGGVLMLIVGNIFAPTYLRLIRTPDNVLSDAIGYLRIYFLSFPVVILYNMSAGILRSLGNSKATLNAQIVGGLTNVVMDAFFLMIFENGVYGVAWATLISQSVAAFLVLAQLRKLDPEYALRLKNIRLDDEIMRQILSVGVSTGLQSLVITLSNVMVQYQINGLGADAMAAFVAYYKVELVIYQPIVALGQAMLTFSGQNKGAGKYERVHQGTKQCLMLGICMTLLTSTFALCAGRVLFRCFNKDAAVIELGLQIIRVSFPFYFLYVILQILGDSVRGMGNVKQPMLIILMNICIIRTILLFTVTPVFPGVKGVAACYPVTWALTAICMSILYIWTWKKFS